MDEKAAAGPADDAPSTVPVLARAVRKFAQDADIGQSTVWKEIREGRLKARRLGRRTIILDEDGKEYLRNLPSARRP